MGRAPHIATHLSEVLCNLRLPPVPVLQQLLLVVQQLLHSHSRKFSSRPSAWAMAMVPARGSGQLSVGQAAAAQALTDVNHSGGTQAPERAQVPGPRGPLQLRSSAPTSRVSVENSKFGPSTMASTGQASWHRPQ